MSQPKNDDVKAEVKTEKPAEAPAPAAAASEAPKAADAKAEQAKGDAPKASDWTDPWKKFAFAAMGAVNLSPDEVKGFVKRLVEKGEIAKKDGEKIVRDFAERVQKTVVAAESKVAAEVKPALEAVESLAKKATHAAAQAAGAAAGDAQKAAEATAASNEKLVEKINASIERVLHGMNIATRKDVIDLTSQIDTLDKKLGQLLGAAEASLEKRQARKPAAAPSSATAAS